MKRFLSLLLALLTVLMLVPAVAVSAEATELTDNSTYNGIRKKSDGSILFSPMMGLLRTDVNAGTYAYDALTFKLVFTQLTGNGGTAVYTFPEAVATTKKGNGNYFDIYLKSGSLNSGFCPTEGCYYNIAVEVYAGGTEIYYGTYTNVKAAGISGSAYYDPTRIPTEAAEIAEPTGSFTAVNDTIYFAPCIAELQAAIEGGDALADYEITLVISKLKDGAVSYTWKTPITSSLTAGDGCFLVPLCGETENVFCPTVGISYQIEVEIIKDNAKVFYGTYTNVACGDDVAECSYYNPTTIAQEIKEAAPSYTGQRYYKYGAYQQGFRVSSKGYILFSPLASQLRDDINAGADYSYFTAYETVTVKDADGKVLHTYAPISAEFGKSSGTYFDVTLQSNTVNSGFCPTVGYYYDIYCEIYRNGELLYYGTYSDLFAVDEIATSAYYSPTSIPGVVDYHVSAEYDFTNTLAGSAAGKITLTSDTAGAYGLYWADAEGAPLTVTVGEKTVPYSALANIVISKNDVNKEIVYTVLPYTVIPMGATQLIVCTSEMEVLASVAVPAEKQLIPETPNFTFGMLSDIHYNQFKSGETDIASVAFPRALAFYKAAGVDLVTGSGDYGVYQEEESYRSVNEAVAAAGLLFLGCGGNHEVYSGKDRIYDKRTVDGVVKDSIWHTYMNTGVYDATPIDGVLNVAPNKIDFVYQIPGDESSVFVFLSQMYNDSGNVTQQHLLETEQVTWLSEQLAAYADKQVYLYFHVYLFDEDGKTANGEGDMTSAGGATYKGGYNTHTAEYASFRALLDQYTNVTWFNGHSHYEYAMQKLNGSLNITDNGGTTATMIHVPSCTSPRTATDTSTSLGQLHGKSSEGGLMLSFDDYDVMIGLDFIGEKAYSYASYIIYKDKSDVVASDTSDGITYTYDAQTSSLYFEGEGEIPAASEETPAPWAAYAALVQEIHIGNGVSAIGAGAFAGFATESLRIPESMTAIGAGAFNGTVGKIVYAGSSAGYAAITVGDGNEALTAATKEFRKYHITFIVEGVATSVDVPVGEVPVYDGVPTKPHSNPQKIYRFSGWRSGSSLSPTLPAAKADATYTAVFGGEATRYVNGLLGTKFSWELDRMTGTLTLYGSGATPDLAADIVAQPWNAYKDEIYTARVCGGITTLGKNTFSRLPALTTIEICEGVKTLNADAFSYCGVLTTLYLPKTITSFGQGIVYQDKVLTTIYFSGTASEWVTFKNRITSLYNDGIKNCEDVIFSSPVAPIYEKGDLDGNFIINIADVTALLSIMADETATVCGNPDFTRDGIVNIKDVTAILTKLAK